MRRLRARDAVRNERPTDSDLADPVDNFLESSRSFFLGKDYIALLGLGDGGGTDRKIAAYLPFAFQTEPQAP